DDAKPVTQSEMYSYDAIYRLVDFKRGMSLGGEIPRPTRGRTWKLDGAHNWTQFDIDNKSYTNSVNKMNEYNDFSADRMTGPIPDDNSMEDEFMSDKSSSGRNFAHDKNGNRISDDILEYYYDYDHRPIATPALRAENRLTMAKDKATGDSLGEYFYDAFGRRIKKQAGGISTVYVYTYGWRAIEEYEGNVLSRSYTYGQWIDEVLTMDRTVDGDRLYYHVNALGSVIALTDSTGLPVEGYSYDAYGQPLFFDSSGTPVEESTIGNPYLFTGRRYDTETGWYYYRSRYLDPIAGRFMTRDTIGIWGDAGNLGNPYTYIANNPANGSDPLGLIPYVNMYVNPRWEATKGGSDITVNDELKHGAVTGVTTFKAERGYHFKYISALLETVEKGNQIIYTWSKPEETYIKIGQVHCITFKGEGCHERCPMAKDYYIQVELRPKVSYVKGNKGVAIHEAWHVYQVADIIYKALKNVNYVEWCNTPDKALKLCEEKVTKLAAKAINTAIFDWNKHHTSIHNIEKGKYSKDPVEVQAREMAERGQWPPEVMRPPEYYKGGLR
ncbi:MAG: RHS repeat domain-containing protein, partial [Candidatus Hodarchaeota archaeon]